ncbi:cyclase family protein [Acuticoccus sp. MNP-M23]|uniref:cyclase family protein n=1 Tax=Acuticoccus sp. MNP-M23 TaxID=3072793 RepID=UPI0028152155|nr:cyclase family protein [Acuticoccus sp. MNP-M23]WMS41251.1 cyclase family protein [Acuticoccus sp. MNP-M23]
MCGQCVIDSVRNTMLSRRNLLRGSTAAVAVAATGGLIAPRPASAQTAGGTLADLTHTLSEDFPTFGGMPGFAKTQQFNFADNGYNLFKLSIDEHTGTHMDAPLHFSSDGASVDEIPVGDLMAPIAKIDIAAKAAENADAQVTPDDIAAWIEANGDLPERFIAAMYSGWGEKAATDGFRNADDTGTMHFPGFHVEAADMLKDTGCIGIAVDTLSLDYGKSPDFATHYSWLPSGRWGLECVANLGALPAAGATMIVGAPKNRGGTGGPSRVFALV